MASRAAFLHDPTHRVVLYDTPKHARLYEKGSKSGARQQVRTLLKRGNLTSLENVRDQILDAHRFLPARHGETQQMDV
jgi:hypothetical protein